MRAIPILLMLASFVGCGLSEPSNPGTDPSAKPNVSNATLANAITTAEAKLAGDVRSRYDAAIAADPFSGQEKLITGKWHGQTKDSEFGYFYEYDRRLDGSMSQSSVEMYGEEKEYLRKANSFVWKSKGRVIYEQDSENSELVSFLLLEEVSDNVMKYKMINPEIGYSEFSEVEDLRGPGSLPELPEGWTQVDE